MSEDWEEILDLTEEEEILDLTEADEVWDLLSDIANAVNEINN